MARISPKSKYPWYIRGFLFFQKRKYKAVFEPLLLWGRAPRVFLGFLFMQKALNRKRSPLEPYLRALITTRISQINACAFCIDMNAFFLLQKGGSEDKINALSQFRTSPLFSEKEKCALEYAEAMTLSSDKVSDELFQRVKQHFTDDSLVELTALIGFQNLSSKFNAALDASAFGFCNVKTGI